MNLKALRGQVGRNCRKLANGVVGLKLNGPVEVFAGMPDGSQVINLEQVKEASASRPVLPHKHPLLEFSPIRYSRTWAKECKGLRVYGPTVAVVDEAGQLLAEVSVEWGRKAEENWSFRRFWLPLPQTVNGKTLILASTGGDTYFHWMTDVLPRIRLAGLLGHEVTSFDHILVNGFDQSFQKETLEHLGVSFLRCLTLPRKEKAYTFASAVLPSLPGVPGVVSVETAEYLKKTFLNSNDTNPRKIFIGREGAKHRPLIHEEQILTEIRKRGFQGVRCGQMSVSDQARIFNAAEIIVGAHGAALTNLVFCRPGTRVIELFSPKYVNPCYRDICVSLDLQHSAVIGSGEDWELSHKHDQPSAPITASWELLSKALEEVDR